MQTLIKDGLVTDPILQGLFMEFSRNKILYARTHYRSDLWVEPKLIQIERITHDDAVRYQLIVQITTTKTCRLNIYKYTDNTTHGEVILNSYNHSTLPDI